MSEETTVPENDQPTGPKRPVTCREMGHKGGSTTARRHGSEFYQRIGKMGAMVTNGKVKPVPEGRGKKGRKGTAWDPPQEAMAEKGQSTDGDA